MRHGQHRETPPRQGDHVAGALPHTGRRPTQQDVPAQGRCRTVPGRGRERQGRRNLRGPGASEGHRRRMGAAMARRPGTSQADHALPVRRDPEQAHPAEVGPGQARQRVPQRRPGLGQRPGGSSLPCHRPKIHRVLSLVLDLAVKDGRLARNVAVGVNLPRTVRHEHRYLTHDQVEDLATATGYPSAASKFSSLDTRANETYRLVVLFLAYTGVRFGEMAALRVGRLDLRRNRAVIAESVTPVQGQGLVWGTPKTHQRREVPIPRFLAAELAAHVAGQEARRSCLRRHPQRPAAASQHVPYGVQRRRPRHRGPRPVSTPAPAHGSEPRDRQRRRCEGRPANARTRLGHHDLGHLRAPVRGPPGRGRGRHGSSARGRTAAPRAVAPCCPSVARARFRRKWRSGPSQRFRWSGPLFGCVPPTGFEPALPP